MEYPLSLTKPAKGNDPAGFAVANDELEHAQLSSHGYEPKWTAPPAGKKAKTPAGDE